MTLEAPPRRLRLDLAYDGTEFAGWQVQPGRRTVQGVLEDALSRLQGATPVRVRGAGRTDAGVHARGQVADCEIRSPLDDEALAYALRRMLPRDLRPLAVRSTRPDFHARNDARWKTYRYRLDLSRAGDPQLVRYALHRPWPLDPARLSEALARLPGRRDWSGFACSRCTVSNRVRDLAEARFEAASQETASFVFTADGFLHSMVRNLVGTLLEIGSGRGGLGLVTEALARGDRRRAGPTAPAHGLCLERVRYDGE